jgi:hypothetical protein
MRRKFTTVRHGLSGVSKHEGLRRLDLDALSSCLSYVLPNAGRLCLTPLLAHYYHNAPQPETGCRTHQLPCLLKELFLVSKLLHQQLKAPRLRCQGFVSLNHLPQGCVCQT